MIQITPEGKPYLFREIFIENRRCTSVFTAKSRKNCKNLQFPYQCYVSADLYRWRLTHAQAILRPVFVRRVRSALYVSHTSGVGAKNTPVGNGSHVYGFALDSALDLRLSGRMSGAISTSASDASYNAMDSTTLVEKAKLAEQAERYDDMTRAMKSLVQKRAESSPLPAEERNLLSVAYKNVVGARRSSIRVLTSLREKYFEQANEDRAGHAKQYEEVIKKELHEICAEVLVGSYFNYLMFSVGLPPSCCGGKACMTMSNFASSPGTFGRTPH